MRSALSASGWHNYSLFIRADGLLFGYLETPELLTVVQAKMAATEVNARWQALMAPFSSCRRGLNPTS